MYYSAVSKQIRNDKKYLQSYPEESVMAKLFVYFVLIFIPLGFFFSPLILNEFKKFRLQSMHD